MESRSIPKFLEVLPILTKEDCCLEFLFEYGILYNRETCSECGANMKKTGNRFRCTRDNCRKSISIFKDSFFAGSKLKCSEVLYLGYLWLTSCKHKTIMIHAGHSPNTVTDYMNFFRGMVEETLETDDTIIGGQGIVIQIDETKIGKRKYHRGHRVDGAWVIVGVEKTDSRLVFAEVVQDRSADTIADVLSRHVAKGSIIYTDCWRGYHSISERFNIQHYTVNHSQGFKDDITGVDTNTVEGTNFAIKNHIPIRNRTKTFIPSYLAEFAWRRIHDKSLWSSFLDGLKLVLYNK